MKVDVKIMFEYLLPLSRVKTPDGIGQIISIDIPSNGLYISPEQATVCVWYGTENAQNGWVSKTYRPEELTPIIN